MLMTTKDLLDDVLFVVVLYRKPAQESPPIQLLTALSLTSVLFIYDNSPQPHDYPSQATYVHDPSNGGVSKAYNEAYKTASELEKKWMMLLDQDTSIDEGFLKVLAGSIAMHADACLFAPLLIDRRGVVSPFQWNGSRGIRLSRVGTTLGLKYFRFQNSGLVVRSDAFAKVGGYDEEIDLDFSDIAFGERMRRITEKFVVVDYRLRHGFSETECVTADHALHRYQKFCRGAFALGRSLEKRWQFYLRALARGLKLSWRHKDASFLRIFFTAC